MRVNNLRIIENRYWDKIFSIIYLNNIENNIRIIGNRNFEKIDNNIRIIDNNIKDNKLNNWK